MEELGSEEHLMTDYGDEETYRDPWTLFGEEEGREALETAKRCVQLARRVFGFYFEKG